MRIRSTMPTITRSRRSSRSNGVGRLSCCWRRLYAQVSMGVPPITPPRHAYDATITCQTQDARALLPSIWDIENIDGSLKVEKHDLRGLCYGLKRLRA